jgi:hypothetical protein
MEGERSSSCRAITSDRPEEPTVEENLGQIAEYLSAYLGKSFPLCCERDEFHYFPQVFSSRWDWADWDNC